MPLPNKILNDTSSLPILKCKYCNDTHCWKHGCYIRTGFHKKHSVIYDTRWPVQRYKCCNPQCRRTFSILPSGIVPYCRFSWKDLLEIASLLLSGTTVYTIAHTIWGLPYRILSRSKQLVHRLKEWFIQLCHESLLPNPETFEQAALFCTQQYPWYTLTNMWDFQIYPCRFGTYLTPHKMAFKRG